MDFNDIWKNMLAHEGDEFHMIKNLPFTYEISKGAVVIDRPSKPRLVKSNFIKSGSEPAAIKPLTNQSISWRAKLRF